jgi:hypothetical protein
MTVMMTCMSRDESTAICCDDDDDEELNSDPLAVTCDTLADGDM